ncbi:MAG: hypothetical protein HY291_13535 [Planctomycetes bacterium]|nr:hypothetical protein [Planctomycetota bacterium]
MREQDLERLRPAHVSPRVMRIWYWSRYLVKTSVVVMGGLFVLTGLFNLMFPLFALAVGVFVLSCLAWYMVIAICFLRYSLGTLMLSTLATATLVSLSIALPGEWKVLPILAGVVWFSVLLLLVLDHDPERRARFYGLPEKPPRPAEKE